MDLTKMISELRYELKEVDRAIAVLEHVVGAGGDRQLRWTANRSVLHAVLPAAKRTVVPSGAPARKAPPRRKRRIWRTPPLLEL